MLPQPINSEPLLRVTLGATTLMRALQVTDRLYFLSSVVLFRIALDYSYIKFISPIFGYEGFSLDVQAGPYLLSWIIYIFAAMVSPNRLDKLSDYFFVIALLSVLAPLTSLYGLANKALLPVLTTAGSVIGVFAIANLKFLKAPKLPIIKNGRLIAFYLSLTMVIYLIAWYFMTGAAGYFNLDFSKVYDYRELTDELANDGVLAYVNNWVLKVFSLFLIAYALLTRRYVLVAITVSIQVFFFGVSAHKSVLFYPVMVFGAWYYFRSRNNLIIIPLGFFGVVIVSLLGYTLLDTITPGTLFIRRVFYVPANLCFSYFEFFSQNEYIYWSNSILSSFIPYPYPIRVTLLVGDYTGSGASANNGYVSSGFAHAGLFGVFIYTIIIGLLLRFIDIAANNTGAVWLALAVTVTPMRSLLVSSDLFTVLLTHGLLLAVLLLLLIQRKQIIQTPLKNVEM